MNQRGVSSEVVEGEVDDPDVTYADIKGNRCSVRELEGRKIRVVLAKDDPEFVITVIA